MFAARASRVFKASDLLRERSSGPAGGSLMDLHADDGSGAYALALRLAGRRQGGKTIIVVESEVRGEPEPGLDF